MGKSTEDYLEAIFVLRRENAFVRAIDIVNKMRFSKPTVSIAMKKLRAAGLVETKKGGHISLTEAGEKIARTIYERHEIIAHILKDLGVNPETAYEDACKIEHDVSEESFACLRAYYLNKQTPPKKSEP